MIRFVLALDLKDDPALIEEYEHLHLTENAWPDITESIAGAGILSMEIYRLGNRFFMVMETVDDFDPVKKTEADAKNPSVQKWENLMWKYQQPLPWATAGEKWVEMKRIFCLNNNHI